MRKLEDLIFVSIMVALLVGGTWMAMDTVARDYNLGGDTLGWAFLAAIGGTGLFVIFTEIKEDSK